MITDTEKLLAENKRLVYELRKAEEMRKCYEHNLQLCNFQEKQIGKLADAKQYYKIENERLKAENEKLKKERNELITENENLQEANEEYVDINKYLDYMLGDVIAKVLKDDDTEEYFYTELKEKFTSKLEKIIADNEHLAEKEEEARHYLNEAYKYKQALEKVKKYCNECNLKADYTACEILTIIDTSD